MLKIDQKMFSSSPKMVFTFLIIAVLVLLFLLKSGQNSSTLLQLVSVGKEIHPSSFMIQVYKDQAKERSSIVQSYRQNSKSSDFLDFYNMVVPEVFCAEMVRVGTVGDGGKWMCSPQNLPQNCNILSLGLNNMISFDVHLQQLSKKKCRLFGYDTAEQADSVQKELAAWNGVSRAARIGSIAEGGTPIEELMKKENIESVEILKMDIEGAEFVALIPYLEKYKVAQIMVEIHSGNDAHVMVDLVAKMAEQGYWIAAYEINGRYHELCEFLMVHESSFERYAATPLARYMI